jgi:hypothetical protein
MIYRPVYFDLHELVCPDVYATYGEVAWSFFDPRLLRTIDVLRARLNKHFIVNTWHEKGIYDERGLRCIKCSTVRKAIEKDQMYFSAHMEGQAIDFDCEGMLSGETREWIKKNYMLLPYPIRLEADVNWIHLDVREVAGIKVYEFKS